VQWPRSSALRTPYLAPVPVSAASWGQCAVASCTVQVPHVKGTPPICSHWSAQFPGGGTTGPPFYCLPSHSQSYVHVNPTLAALTLTLSLFSFSSSPTKIALSRFSKLHPSLSLCSSSRHKKSLNRLSCDPRGLYFALLFCCLGCCPCRDESPSIAYFAPLLFFLPLDLSVLLQDSLAVRPLVHSAAR
jgi:hypothetical protein